MENMIIAFDYVGMDNNIHTEVYRHYKEEPFIVSPAVEFAYIPAKRILQRNLASIVSFNVYYFDNEGKYIKESYYICSKKNKYKKFLNKNYENEKEKLEQLKLQISLLNILSRINKHANDTNVSLNETVGDFMNHSHLCKSRSELLTKLDEWISLQEESKIKRK